MKILLALAYDFWDSLYPGLGKYLSFHLILKAYLLLAPSHTLHSKHSKSTQWSSPLCKIKINVHCVLKTLPFKKSVTFWLCGNNHRNFRLFRQLKCLFY